MSMFPWLCQRRVLFAKKAFSLFLLLGLIVQPLTPSLFVSGFFIPTTFAEGEATNESDDNASTDKESEKVEDTVEDKVEQKAEEASNEEAATTDEVVVPEVITETPSTATEEEVPLEEATALETEEVKTEQEPASETETPKEEKKEVAPWQVEGDKATTTEAVKLGVKYEAPQNKAVTVTFTKLPETPGTLSIEEITLTNEQREATGALSETAYDITSSMENGSFEYELTLPIPKGSDDVKIKYADDAEGLKDAKVVDEDDIKTEGNSVKAELDHFTVFVATYSGPSLSVLKTSYVQGETVWAKATFSGADFFFWHRLDVVEPNGTKHKIAGCSIYTSSISGSYTLPVNANLAAGWKVMASRGYLLASTCNNDIAPIDALAKTQAFTVTELDVTPPSVPVNGLPNGTFELDNEFDFTWDASTDNFPGAITYEYQASMNPAQSGGVLTTGIGSSGVLTSNMIHSSGADDGTWYWQVRARDAAGNTSAWSEIWSMTIDSVAPVAPTVTVNESGGDPISNGGLTNSYGITVNWNAVTGATSYDYRYSNSIPGNPYNAPNYYVVSGLTTTSLSGVFNQGDGLHHVEVRARDAAGNASPWSTLFNINYDGTAPAIPTLVSPADGIPVNGTNPIANDWNDVADAHHYVYQSYNVNGAGNCNLSSIRFTSDYTASQTNSRAFADGLKFCWRVKAVDAAGNESAWSTLWKTIADNSAPTVPVHLSPADNTFTTTALQTSIDWADSTDANSPITYQYQSSTSNATNPDGSFVSPAYTSGTLAISEIPTPGTPENVYYWHVRAQDTAGNWSAWSTPWKITVDNTAPNLVSQTTFSGWYTSSQTSTFDYADAIGIVSGTPVTCEITTEGVGQTCAPATVNVCDASGNCNTTPVVSNGADIDMSLPTVAFSISPTNPDGDNDWYTSEPQVTLTAEDAISGIDYTEYRLNGGSWVTYSSPFALTDGIWTVEYRTFDIAGNESATGTVSNIKVDTENPDEVNDLDAEYRQAEDDIKLTWDADDNDIDRVFIYRGSSSGFNINSGNRIGINDDNDETFSDNNPELGRTYYYKLVSVDEAGNHSGANTIRVEMPEEEGGAAVVTALGTQPVAEGTVLGAETAANEEGQDGNTDGTVTVEGEVLGANTEEGRTNGVMDFIKKYSWWWLIVLLIIGYTWYRYHSKKQNPLG